MYIRTFIEMKNYQHVLIHYFNKEYTHKNYQNRFKKVQRDYIKESGIKCKIWLAYLPDSITISVDRDIFIKNIVFFLSKSVDDFNKFYKLLREKYEEVTE